MKIIKILTISLVICMLHTQCHAWRVTNLLVTKKADFRITPFFQVQTITSSSNQSTIDWNDGSKAHLTLDENTTLTMSPPKGASNLLLTVEQDGGSNTLEFASSNGDGIFWTGQTDPTMTETDGRVDVYTLYYDGSNYYGAFSQDY